MRPQDFDTLAKLLHSHSGLVLAPDQTYLLQSRLEPVARKWNLPSVERLADALRAGTDSSKLRDVVEAMTTNESSFFRDTRPFDQFRDTIMPHLLQARAGTRSIRIWSAAASAGQEAYSIAMLLKERGAELAGWRIELVGTDLSTGMVERAKAGLYTQFEVQRGLPAKFLVKYFKKAGDKWQVADELRQAVQFRQFNLLHDAAPLGKFDVVFCRNVLIYFDVPAKAKVLRSIRNQIAPDGYLLLGAAETVLGVSECFRTTAGSRGLYAPALAA